MVYKRRSKILDYTHVSKMSDREFEGFLKTNPPLSRNFRLDEFTRSQTASRHGIDNTPTKEAFLNLVFLCKHVLQPIRTYYGRPVSISSGYRCLEVNEIIGGSEKSQHMFGKAVDFEIMGLDNYAVALKISKIGIVFDQLILEHHNPRHPQSGWVHISYDRDKIAQRRQLLTIDNEHGTRGGLHYD